MYPPIHMAGSETTLHASMREIAKRGHDVTVIADRTPEDYEYEGVKVKSLPQNQFHHSTVREIAKDADLLVTHLDCTSLAMTLAVDLQKPLAHFIHNHAQLSYWNTPPHKAQLVIFNSHWVAMNETYKDEPWPGESVIVHPIVEPEKYRCERGTKITLCNPTSGKGAHTIYALAEAMPDFEFLVVEGIYGEQIAPPNLSDEWIAAHPNVEHMKNTPDFREVLRKTKVLLMPSNYESYGRCAVEAACAGIPSIVHPTQGLWEALGDGRRYPAVNTRYGVEGSVVIASETLPMGLFDNGLVNGAGIFCHRIDDIPANVSPEHRERMEKANAVYLEGWKAQIERLYSDEVYYRSRADAAMKLANSLNPQGEFDRLEEALLNTLALWQKRDEVMNVAMWTSDKRLWETTDGKLVAEVNGRIPQDAVRLACGIGGQITEDAARANGLLPPLPEEEVKAIEAPAENKAIEAPAENKATKQPGKKKKVA